MREKKASLQDVANQAGVSRVAASVILNGARSRARVSDATRQRILEAADKLQYRPSASAKALITGRTGSIALILSTRHNHSFLTDPLLDGIHDALSERGLRLSLARLPDEKLCREGFLPQFMREWAADGLIVSYTTDIPVAMVSAIDRFQLPSVWLNAERATDCIRPADEAAALAATGELIKLGHRKIAFTCHSTTHFSRQCRAEAYRKSMTDEGLEPLFLEFPRGVRGWVEEMTRIFSDSDRPTALLTYDPFTARPVLFAALQSGLSLPKDLSLMMLGARSEPEDPMTGRKIDAWTLPDYEMGRKSVEMLVRKLDGSGSEPAVEIPLNRKQGDTCGVAP